MQKKDQKKRIIGRALAQELSLEDLKKIDGGHSGPGTCTNGVDCDADMVAW